MFLLLNLCRNNTILSTDKLFFNYIRFCWKIRFDLNVLFSFLLSFLLIVFNLRATISHRKHEYSLFFSTVKLNYSPFEMTLLKFVTNSIDITVINLCKAEWKKKYIEFCVICCRYTLAMRPLLNSNQYLICPYNAKDRNACNKCVCFFLLQRPYSITTHRCLCNIKSLCHGSSL